jgi:hypothetical protein
MDSASEIILARCMGESVFAGTIQAQILRSMGAGEPNEIGLFLSS